MVAADSVTIDLVVTSGSVPRDVGVDAVPPQVWRKTNSTGVGNEFWEVTEGQEKDRGQDWTSQDTPDRGRFGSSSL